jgi:catechol 2,3-dioxygenase-like lactoylglutathione lyase family enzyme
MTDAAAQALGTLAPHFFQAAYVVPEIGAAEDWFRRVLGVPYFLRMPNIVLGDTCRHRGRPADAAMHISLGYARDVQIELIESVRGPSIYSEFLDAGRTGLHHVAFAVPDFTRTMRSLRDAGMAPVADGCLSTGMRVDFAYFDCSSAGASMIEILGFDAAARSFMEDLKTRTGD